MDKKFKEALMQGLVQAAFSAIGPAWAAVQHQPLASIFGWSIVSLAIAGIARYAWNESKAKRWTSLVRLATAVVVGLVIAWGIWFFTHIRVDPALSDLYEKYPALGAPISRSKQIHEAVYQAWYDKAIVVNFGPEVRPLFFVIQKTKDHPWDTQSDEGPLSDPRWSRLALRRKDFPECDNELPPFGGVAVGLKEPGNTWPDIGCVQSHCDLDSAQARIQQFEHGYILGGMRQSKDYPAKRAFVLVYGKPWTEEVMPGESAICNSPDARSYISDRP